MIITETQQPPEMSFVWSWQRSKDPFHAEAFPAGLEFAGTNGERKNGWLGLDKWENPVIFVEDGATVDENGKLQIDLQVVNVSASDDDE